MCTAECMCSGVGGHGWGNGSKSDWERIYEMHKCSIKIIINKNVRKNNFKGVERWLSD